MKRQRKATTPPSAECASPQKRQKTSCQKPGKNVYETAYSIQQREDIIADSITVAASSGPIDTQTWSQLIDDSYCAVDSSSSDVTSPQSSNPFDISHHSEFALFSPLEAVTSPVTECSEWPSSSLESSDAATKELIDYFSETVAPLLFFDVDEPAQHLCELLVSLVTDEAPITAAMCALSSVHLEHAGATRGKRPATDYHNMALARLATLIESGSGHEMALSTILLLISYELLVHGSSSEMMEHHLRGAYSTMLALQGEKSDLTKSLERQFQRYDVILALSSGRDPISHAPAMALTAVGGPACKKDSPMDGAVEDIWPVLHRLAALPGLKQELAQAVAKRQCSQAAVLRGEISSMSRAIEGILLQRTALLSERTDLPPAPLTLGYMHSALVFLYRHVLGYPQRHHLVQISAQASLAHCQALVTAGKSNSRMLWPLFTAACEAVGSERLLAGQIFESIIVQQHISDMNQAWFVTQKIWTSVDENARKGLRAEDTATAWRRIEESSDAKVVLF